MIKPMSKRRFLQVDVFTDRAGFGNPLAVVLDSEGLDTIEMQRFATWTNLSETIFLLPPSKPEADYRVRIFTPHQELPFAGHPSVGAAWVVVETGIARPRHGRLIQECAAGLLEAHVLRNQARTQTRICTPPATIRELDEELQTQILPIFGVSECIDSRACRLVNNGPEWLIVELPDEETVRRFQPPLALIADLCVASSAVGLAIFACCESADYKLAVRAFCPADGIPEDPVTGSANAAIAALLQSQSRLGGIGPKFLASQGREIGRDGRVDIEVDPSSRVWIGGHTTLVVEGSVTWP